jgi:small subunit ribosomal protein S19
MSRSIKKGPFADSHLIKKIEAQESSEKKQVIKT